MAHVDVIILKTKGKTVAKQNEYERDPGLNPDSVLYELCGIT